MSNKLFVNEHGRQYTTIGAYRVVKESEHMTCIYKGYGEKLITSKPQWSQAFKLATLLNEAYEDGIKSTTEDDGDW